MCDDQAKFNVRPDDAEVKKSQNHATNSGDRDPDMCETSRPKIWVV